MRMPRIRAMTIIFLIHVLSSSDSFWFSSCSVRLLHRLLLSWLCVPLQLFPCHLATCSFHLQHPSFNRIPLGNPCLGRQRGQLRCAAGTTMSHTMYNKGKTQGVPMVFQWCFNCAWAAITAIECSGNRTEWTEGRRLSELGQRRFTNPWPGFQQRTFPVQWASLLPCEKMQCRRCHEMAGLGRKYDCDQRGFPRWYIIITFIWRYDPWLCVIVWLGIFHGCPSISLIVASPGWHVWAGSAVRRLRLHPRHEITGCWGHGSVRLFF